MKIISANSFSYKNYVTENRISAQKKYSPNPIFKSYEPAKAKEIAKKIENIYGTRCDFGDNGFLAECVEKTTNVFSNLFGKSKLPSYITYKKEKAESHTASFNYLLNTVNFNKDKDNTWYKNMDTHKTCMKEEEHFILPDWASSRHPAHVFTHEYGHCVHWHHLEEKLGHYDAQKVWNGLVGTNVPTAIGRLITKYKISNYAIKGNDMCEFMAERMAKDVCKGLTDNLWIPYKDIDIKYDDIFNRKWSYRYSSPQSYIDYFTQQVWNGDIEGAERVGREAGEYLARLEAVPVAQPIKKIQTATQETIFEKIGNALYNWGEAITKRLDDRNDIKLKQC